MKLNKLFIKQGQNSLYIIKMICLKYIFY